MLPAGVILTGMLLAAVMVMAAMHIWVIEEGARQKGGYRLVGAAAGAAVKPNASLCQRGLSASANTAANEHIHLVGF